jgi:hypothetical protein
MIFFRIGNRYETEGFDLALSDEEWERLQHAKRKVKLFSEDGLEITIRRQTPKEKRS